MADARSRNRGWRAIFILVGLALVATVIVVAVVAANLNTKPSVASGSVLAITLDGAYTDAPTDDPFAELGLSGSAAGSTWSIRQALRAAATDDNIAGVFLTVRSPQLGMGQRQELAAEIERYRETSGKSVHALLETDMVGDGNYYLASAASKVWVTPEAWWMVNGLQADVTFWRGTLDKLDIEPNVIMFKEFKSAGEPFQAYEMSEPMRESLTDILGDVYDAWLDDVAERRDFDRARLESLVNLGTIPGSEALASGLADELGYRDQVEEALKIESGAEDYTSISLKKYLSSLPDAPSGDRVAVVFADGPIVATPGQPSPFSQGAVINGPNVAADLRKAAEDDNVKAIVFRINSPGGSAVGSDLIWREIERAQANGKPVIASMGSVAASGGYWVSMGADKIVANEATITGSIGVVFSKLNIDGLYGKIGANVQAIRLGDNPGLLSPYESFDEAQLAQVTTTIESTYNSFVQKVADGRGMAFDDVEPLAHGRVWSGKDAKDHGLVDEVGGLDMAIALAASAAEMGEDPTVVPYPAPKDFFEQLLEGEFGVRTSAPSVAELEAWVLDVSAPKVQALAPTIRIH